MQEGNYHRSIDLLQAQVRKIEQSVSAQDPFCQQLIKDLQHHYPTERDYRLSQMNAYTQHSSERATYSIEHSHSVCQYRSPHQVIIEFNQFNKNNTSKH